MHILANQRTQERNEEETERETKRVEEKNPCNSIDNEGLLRTISDKSDRPTNVNIKWVMEHVCTMDEECQQIWCPNPPVW